MLCSECNTSLSQVTKSSGYVYERHPTYPSLQTGTTFLVCQITSLVFSSIPNVLGVKSLCPDPVTIFVQKDSITYNQMYIGRFTQCIFGKKAQALALPIIALARCTISAQYIDPEVRTYVVKRHVFESNRNLSVRALAGSGKTTMLLNIIKQRPKYKFLYLCYNRSVRDETVLKLQQSKTRNCTVMTYDALCYELSGISTPPLEEITPKYLEATYPITMEWTKRQQRGFIDLYGEYCRSVFDTIDEFFKTIKLSTVPRTRYTPILKELVGINGPITFDILKKRAYHEQWLTRIADKYQVLLIDETQDLNMIMFNSITKQLGHLPKVFVGDSKQSIYKFNGCVDAFELLPSENTLTLELYRTFRIGPPLSDFICKETGVYMIPDESSGRQTQLHVNEVPEGIPYTYLFRTWKNLLSVAARTSKCFIRGLESKIEQLIERARENNDEMSVRELEETYSNIKDHHVMEQDAMVKFTTIHSYKGCEDVNIRVYSDAVCEDDNLYYVALTRATHHLYLDFVPHCTETITPAPRLLSKINSHPHDQHIEFIEEGHLYLIDGKVDSQLMSVTTFIHSLFEHFDADKVIEKMMNSKNWSKSPYYGMTPDEIKNKWETNRDEAARAGTKMHLSIENYYNGLPIDPDVQDSVEYSYFKKFCKDFPYEAYRTEWFVFDPSVKIAGSIDMVFQAPGFDNDGENLLIYDWKRSKEIRKTNIYSKGKPPLDHLPDCNFVHYMLQLNVYKYILESRYGKKIHELALVVLHPNQSTYARIPVPVITKEIETLWQMRKERLAINTLDN